MPVSRFFLYSVGILLIGYAIFDKSFAYIGVPPLFVGEIVLGIGLLSALAGGISPRLFSAPITWAILVYAAWGVARTVPYLDVYGLLAIRDSVLWMYTLFTILVASALLKTRDIGIAARWYTSWIPWFLVLAPIAFFAFEKYLDVLPRLPFSNVPIFWTKASDMAVHLAGIITFMGLGLHRHFANPLKGISNTKEFIMWMLVGFDIIAAGSRNRGGFLSVVVACFIMMMFKPMNRLNRFVLPGLLLLALGLVFDVNIPVGGERSVSVQQIIDNIQSVVSESDKKYLSETPRWRLEWWRRIEAETISGEYFWLGKGNGISLAESNDFDDGTGNRSPHNVNLTILARSGVPGLILWFLAIGTVSVCMVQGFFRAQAMGHHVLAKLNVWVLAYLMAFLVDASFDVFLEGPQGGIWFWCLIGFAVALNIEQRSLVARARSGQQASRKRAAARG